MAKQPTTKAPAKKAAPVEAPPKASPTVLVFTVALNGKTSFAEVDLAAAESPEARVDLIAKSFPGFADLVATLVGLPTVNERIDSLLEEKTRELAGKLNAFDEDADRQLEERRTKLASDLRAADEEAERQLEEKRKALAGALAALDAGNTKSTDAGGALATGRSGDAAPPAAEVLTEVIVTGPRQGRWRGGQHFASDPRTVFVTAAQLALIKGDPSLSHEVVAD